MKTKVTIAVDTKSWKKFKQKCVKEDTKYSHKIEELIKNEM